VKTHRYGTTVEWTGNRGSGTSSYRAYDRNHRIIAPGKPDIPGSADPAFRGAPDRYNPEELLVASLSACHMLWYLHLCAEAGIVATAYRDDAEAILAEHADGSGEFTEAVLRPRVTLAEGADRARAAALHEAAHAKCFIARSVRFPVRVEPVFG